MHLAPGLFIERTLQSLLRRPWPAAHVEREATEATRPLQLRIVRPEPREGNVTTFVLIPGG